MITKFTTYIKESRKSVEDLEMLNPEELGKLLCAEVSTRKPNLGYVQDILDVGCPINVRAKWGWTPIHLAAYLEELDVVEFLISRGAEVNAINDYGITALHYAAGSGDMPMVELLTSSGIDIDIRSNDGKSALYFAAHSGHVDVIKFLISRGGNIHDEDEFGLTAWDVAKPQTKEAVPELNPKA